MKSIVCLVSFVSLVASMPQQGAQPGPAAAAPQRPQGNVQQTLGPRFFGPGLNNQFALAPNPQQISVAQRVLQAIPNARAFVDVDGQIEFTDQFGREIEVTDTFGNSPLELLNPQEQLERQREAAERQFEEAQLRARIQAQQNLLNQISQNLGTANQGGVSPLLGLEGFEGLEGLENIPALANNNQFTAQ